MNEERTCICGHRDNRHEDVDDGTRQGDWGVGKCELCNCKRFGLRPDKLTIAVEALEKIASMEHLTFAECSDAEFIMNTAKQALDRLAEGQCSACNGSGKYYIGPEVEDGGPCPKCNGTGKTA